MPRKQSNAPFVVRWRNDVLNDQRVSKSGALSALALTIYARVLTGDDCHPSAAQCARKLRVGERTIERGWKELKELGWLEVRQTPESTRGAAGAIKIFRWPEKGQMVPARSNETKSGVPKCPDHPDVAMWDLSFGYEGYEHDPDSSYIVKLQDGDRFWSCSACNSEAM